MNKNILVDYILHLADNSLILGHRLSEWCGHGPILEVDIALSNIALDNIGAARSFYQYAAELEGGGKTEDSYPYHRDVMEFRNVLLVEQPNGDFADTMARSLFFDTYQYHFYTALQKSTDSTIAAIAQKSLKEVSYHFKFSSEWVVRLGDGTDESKQKMQRAINELWQYWGELFAPSNTELEMQQQGVAPDITSLKPLWEESIMDVLKEASLQYPMSTNGGWHHSGGKIGMHSEYIGYILADMQYLQKTYPGSEW